MTVVPDLLVSIMNAGTHVRPQGLVIIPRFVEFLQARDNSMLQVHSSYTFKMDITVIDLHISGPDAGISDGG